METNEKKVFISYSRDDEPFIFPIAKLLRTLRPDLVFYDKLDILSGKRWEPQIAVALDQADILVLFWCEHSAKSKYVRKEYNFALKNNKDVLSLLFDETLLRKSLSYYQNIDFKNLDYHGRLANPHTHYSKYEEYMTRPKEVFVDEKRLRGGSFGRIAYISILIIIITAVTVILEKYTSIPALKYLIIAVLIPGLLLPILLYLFNQNTMSTRHEKKPTNNNHLEYMDIREEVASAIVEKLNQKFPTSL